MQANGVTTEESDVKVNFIYLFLEFGNCRRAHISARIHFFKVKYMDKSTR